MDDKQLTDEHIDEVLSGRRASDDPDLDALLTALSGAGTSEPPFPSPELRKLFEVRAASAPGGPVRPHRPSSPRRGRPMASGAMAAAGLLIASGAAAAAWHAQQAAPAPPAPASTPGSPPRATTEIPDTQSTSRAPAVRLPSPTHLPPSFSPVAHAGQHQVRLGLTGEPPAADEDGSASPGATTGSSPGGQPDAPDQPASSGHDDAPAPTDSAHESSEGPPAPDMSGAPSSSDASDVSDATDSGRHREKNAADDYRPASPQPGIGSGEGTASADSGAG